MEVPVKENALIAVEKLDITVVFSEDGMAKLLKEVETKVIAHVPDTTTEHGRKDIASLAYKITRSKTLIDDLGKDVVSDWKKKAKLIDGHRKTARDFLDNLKNKVRQPLVTWEEEKERIQAEKEAAEKVKIDDRVTALFAVNVNIPYFDAAMLNDAEFETMLDEATNNHMAERLRIQEEEKAKEEEGARLKDERAAQEAEASRLAEIQAAQETKERELKEQQEAIEKAKREEKERIDREAFEKQAKADALIQVEKDREREKIEQIAKVEETRLRSLQAVGFVYPAKDLGTMQDKKFFALHDKYKKIWDGKQKAILAEELEQKRLKKEKATAAEKARKAELASDKEKIIDLAMTIRQIISPPAIKNEIAKEIVKRALAELTHTADNLVWRAEDL